jgi:cyclophilin family peptidyl-prolyl cis-trans isomerase
MSRAAAVAVLGTALAVITTLPVSAQEPPPGSGPDAVAVAPAKPVGPEVVVETEKGSFTIRLLPAVAPKHVELFLETAKAGGYDGTTFHRIIMGGIIQGGDPLTKDPTNAERFGTGGLGLLKAELSDLPFVRGTVAAVRRPSSMDSGGKQFFVCLMEQKTLQGQYTIFGEVTSGMEVVDQISLTPVDGQTDTERVEMKVTLKK